ncbi:hypothetical protein PI125_g18503 [Phytophthora idaei]|nr:hypothetical protein PI125_g18503 [Phytophthora idaei]
MGMADVADATAATIVEARRAVRVIPETNQMDGVLAIGVEAAMHDSADGDTNNVQNTENDVRAGLA